jgi:hypothetical protein
LARYCQSWYCSNGGDAVQLVSSLLSGGLVGYGTTGVIIKHADSTTRRASQSYKQLIVVYIVFPVSGYGLETHGGPIGCHSSCRSRLWHRLQKLLPYCALAGGWLWLAMPVQGAVPIWERPDIPRLLGAVSASHCG